MKAKPHPEQGFRACLGILRLARSYASARIDRLVHNAHRLTLKGDSLRKAAAKRQKLDDEPAN